MFWGYLAFPNSIRPPAIAIAMKRTEFAIQLVLQYTQFVRILLFFLVLATHKYHPIRVRKTQTDPKFKHRFGDGIAAADRGVLLKCVPQRTERNVCASIVKHEFFPKARPRSPEPLRAPSRPPAARIGRATKKKKKPANRRHEQWRRTF